MYPLFFVFILIFLSNVVAELFSDPNLKSVFHILLENSEGKLLDDAVDVKLRFSAGDVKTINAFVKDTGPLILAEDVLAVLRSSIVENDPDEEETKYISASGIPAHVVILLSVGSTSACLLWLVMHRHPLTPLLVFIFVFSVCLAWNWWSLYQEEVTRRLHHVPAQCRAKQASWLHSFRAAPFDAECEGAGGAPLGDPLSLVAPTKVVSSTVWMLCVTPVSLVADAISSLILQLSGELAWPLNWLVLVLLSLVLVGGMVVCLLSGIAALFKVNVKFSLGLLSADLKAARSSLPRPRRFYRPRKPTALPPPPPSET